MSQYLPPLLLNLFKPGPPVIPFPEPEPESHERKYRQPFSGIAGCLKEFEDPKDQPPPFVVESREAKRQRKQREREERARSKLEKDLEQWKPQELEDGTKDAFKTLFIGRLSYDVTEDELTKELERYGPVRKIVMVTDKETGKPRGYAFAEFEHERDMRDAYKYMDGKRIHDRRVVVDVERGRTVDGWKPRRLGGGLGGTRIGGKDQNIIVSGRTVPRERESRPAEKEKEKDGRGHDRDRDRGRDRDRDRDRERPVDRDRHRDRDRDRRRDSRDHDRHRDRHGDRDRDRDRRRDDYRPRERDERRGSSRPRHEDRPPRSGSRGGGGSHNPNMEPLGQRRF